MWDKLEQIEKRYEELNKQIALPEIASNPKQLQTLAQERASVEDVVTKYREYKTTSKALEDTRAMLNDGLDEEMTALVKQEIENLQSARTSTSGVKASPSA
jgi:peptide chain release factor 1